MGKIEKVSSYLWRKYADYLWTKSERFLLWNMVEPYARPKSFTPVVTIYVAAFYTGVIGAAITEQLYKEKYWEDHPGEVVPLMKPKFYPGPWKVAMGEVPAHHKEEPHKT
ncbi:embryo defective [Trema orientale]|uniref:Embryo defective n=1 Tax=Trema orientale TaxID=63057 RepID=A0A2P5D8N6_TREOI|nr:embryo defective [Trema orientale]